MVRMGEIHVNLSDNYLSLYFKAYEDGHSII